MRAQDSVTLFDDAPTRGEVGAVIRGWRRPEPPARLRKAVSAFGAGGESAVRERRGKTSNLEYKSQLEVRLISWLYDFIRANIKRGRFFDLRQVLHESSADCLGYAKLFATLGRILGLDAGIIEVVIDNAGRYVPHTAVLVRLANRRWRLVDLWYGSKNIKHLRVGLSVRRGTVWRIKDLDLAELDRVDEISFLPDACVNAISLYIRGNRHLNRQEFAEAVKCYSKAIELYPGNARLYYNRAIAYESLGEIEKAKSDYARALSNEASVTRVLATEHEEVTSLIELDSHGIDNTAQEIYLWHKRFVTGREVSLARVAKRLGLSEQETATLLSSVEAKMAAGSG